MPKPKLTPKPKPKLTTKPKPKPASLLELDLSLSSESVPLLEEPSTPLSPSTSFESYIRKEFSLVKKQAKYTARISSECVQQLNFFFHQLICHLTRSASKIAQSNHRKTVLSRDIDDACFVLFAYDTFHDASNRFRYRIERYHAVMKNPHRKKPMSFAEKLDVKYPPSRVLQIMRSCCFTSEIHVSQDAVIYLVSVIDEIIGVAFFLAMKKHKKIKNGIKYAGLITWPTVREVFLTDTYYSFSYCRFMRPNTALSQGSSA